MTAETPAGQTPIGRLPAELQLYIANFADAEDRLHLGRVNSAWRAALADQRPSDLVEHRLRQHPEPATALAAQKLAVGTQGLQRRLVMNRLLQNDVAEILASAPDRPNQTQCFMLRDRMKRFTDAVAGLQITESDDRRRSLSDRITRFSQAFDRAYDRAVKG